MNSLMQQAGVRKRLRSELDVLANRLWSYCVCVFIAQALHDFFVFDVSSQPTSAAIGAAVTKHLQPLLQGIYICLLLYAAKVTVNF